MSQADNHSRLKGGRPVNAWTAAALLLAAVIITGGAVIMSRLDRGDVIEISLEAESSNAGLIYIGGEVNNPGLYPLRDGDTIRDVLAAAGGPTEEADPARMELFLPGRAGADVPQKIDINRAEAWLLAALPGVGETRAVAVVEYRKENGPFRDIDELLKVTGIGSVTLEAVREMITVSEYLP